jgi:hypothetical protein
VIRFGSSPDYKPRPRRCAGGVRGGEEAAGDGEAAGGGVLSLRPKIQEDHGDESPVIDEVSPHCLVPLVPRPLEFLAFG